MFIGLVEVDRFKYRPVTHAFRGFVDKKIVIRQMMVDFRTKREREMDLFLGTSVSQRERERERERWRRKCVERCVRL